MTSPSPYEQYPRPSAPAGPSSWQQPAFAATDDSSPPETAAAPEHPLPVPSSLPAVLVRLEASRRHALRGWAWVTLVFAVLSMALSLVAVTMQSTAFFGVAMLMAMGVGLGLLGLARGALGLPKHRPGPHEDNG